MRKRDPGMYRRMREELYKLGDSNRVAAEKLGCDPQLVAAWLQREYMPSTYYMQAFHEAGADIMYIITGERSHFSSGS